MNGKNMTVLEKDLNETDSSKRKSTELAGSPLTGITRGKEQQTRHPSSSTNTLLLVPWAQGSQQKQKAGWTAQGKESRWWNTTNRQEPENQQGVCKDMSQGRQRDANQNLLLNVMTLFPTNAIKERGLSHKKVKDVCITFPGGLSLGDLKQQKCIVSTFGRLEVQNWSADRAVLPRKAVREGASWFLPASGDSCHSVACGSMTPISPSVFT